MMKRSHCRALQGLAIALLLAMPTPPPIARQEEEKPAPEASTPTPATAKTTPESTTSTRPPRHGKFIGDHWTPYDPPSVESFPEGSKLHIIQKGDTLWDLSGKYLENPFLWPQIWEVNQYITDSHWIYPGDPLLIPGKPIVIGEKGPEQPIEQQEPPATTEQPAMPAAPSGEQPPSAAPPAVVTGGSLLTPIAGESELYCSNYIVDSFAMPDLFIEEREDGSRSILGPGDIVYLSRGLDSQLTTGDEYTVVKNEGIVPHPIFTENVGESIRMMGRVRIIALQESSATAEIVQACDGIEVGMPLVPFEEIPVPLAAPAPFRRYGVQFDTGNAGYIVDSTPDKTTIGEGDIVNVDLGSDNGLRPGDILTVFREWGGVVSFDSPASYLEGEQARAERHRAEGSTQPGQHAQLILGQAVVLRTQKHTATALLIITAREASLGDRVAAR